MALEQIHLRVYMGIHCFFNSTLISKSYFDALRIVRGLEIDQDIQLGKEMKSKRVKSKTKKGE